MPTPAKQIAPQGAANTLLAAQIPDALEIRTELQTIVRRNLEGPENGPFEEVDDYAISERYLCGIIAPRRRKFLRAEVAADTLGAGDKGNEEGPVEPAQPQAMTMFPSAFGFTFTLPLDVQEIQVSASWGHYSKIKSETGFVTKTGEPKTVWKRRPVEADCLMAIRDGDLKPWYPDLEEMPDVRVRGRARKRSNEWIVSLFLVNDNQEPDTNSDSAWLFQAQLRVESPDGKAIFKQHSIALDGDKADAPAWTERRQLAMLYRKRVEFAVGHNVSVHSERDKADSSCAFALQTTSMPSYEVERQDPPQAGEGEGQIPGLQGLVLNMDTLADLPQAKLVASLRPLEEAYAEWIEERYAEIEDPDSDLQRFSKTARETLESCERARRRIHEGITLLEHDQRAWEAFRFANRAMALQRVHSLWAEARRSDEKAELATFDVPANRSWRPFQIAFILLNLPSLANVEHPDRTGDVDANADLLWFPTGGGKTEAYLGLTAFTLGIRRLQGTIAKRSGLHGVAVLMRYTLRLLTLQQFQRASALICACETLRRDNPDTWGSEPFRLGLWVGSKTTPNSTLAAAESIDNARGNGGFTGGATPAQLTNCPWCGTPLDEGKQIKVDKERGRTVMYCANWVESCPFTERNSPGEGIPALVVDEEIYRILPSLLIATVDKFAQMTWNGRTGMLFGQVNGYCPRHGFTSPEIDDADAHPAKNGLPATKTIPCGPLRPPDLIIQDELHLISGPLGTLVGLYETAVDALCSWPVNGKVVRPKVVASTATIRNARRQIHALFGRHVEVFPPPGLDADDNFFSRRKDSSVAAPGRLYVGVCAPGKRLKLALIRVYTAYMAAAETLYQKYGSAADPYLTTIGYFNSMRELGGMRRLVDDDVTSRLRHIEERGLKPRTSLKIEELTSRRSATDIPGMLDRLGAIFDPKLAEERKRAYRENRKPKTQEPLDVLLATNMISVGVDVPRLGLMIVGGQPKSTSEYIQATSRVGRAKPGIVCTVFNWARPRDLSHYERFEHYHATFYQHVEALSVTPFAPRALDRGLTALLVALIRLEDPKFNANLQAMQVTERDDLVQRAIEIIRTRAGVVTESNTVKNNVTQALTSRLSQWEARALATTRSGVVLGYDTSRSSNNNGSTQSLLERAGAKGWDVFTCLNSLRDVEPLCNLVLRDGGMDEDPEG